LTYNRGPAHRTFVIINTAFLVFLSLTMIIPFLNVLAVSLTTDLDSYSNGILLFPPHPSISGYVKLFSVINILQPVLNNILVTVVGTFFHVILCSMAGYVLVKERFYGKTAVVLIITIPMMIPFQMIMIPVYVVMRWLGLIDRLLALILTDIVTTFSILLMRNYFESIPKSLEESAYIDGAHEMSILFRIFLPLAAPGLATVALFEFVGRWNQFLPAVLFINSSAKYTLQVALRSLVVNQSTSNTTQQVANNARMAGIVVSVIPLVVAYVFAQRYFIKGMMIGSVKE
jgi:putative aldouronate transport system permease protein